MGFRARTLQSEWYLAPKALISGFGVYKVCKRPVELESCIAHLVLERRIMRL